MTAIQRQSAAIEAAASHAQVMAQARFVMAAQRPRSWDAVRVELLAECKRPEFAEVARYRMPVGREGIEGPSIRFAEAALRAMKNLAVSATDAYDDDLRRVIRLEAIDLETNASFAKEISVPKTMERRKLYEGQVALAQRTTSRGEAIYVVPADEGSLKKQIDAEIAKAQRVLILRFLRGDIMAECLRQIDATLKAGVAQAPDAWRKKLVDSFAALGVAPKDLVEFLGHDIDKITPRGLDDLRGVYVALEDGETTWPDVLAMRRGEKKPEPQQPADSGPTPEKPERAKEEDAPATAPTARGASVSALWKAAGKAGLGRDDVVDLLEGYFGVSDPKELDAAGKEGLAEMLAKDPAATLAKLRGGA